MSFSGKKYRRVRWENVEDLANTAVHTQSLKWIMKCHAPVFSFTCLDKARISYTLLDGDKVLRQMAFVLGQEYYLERLDGAKIRIRYTLIGANVLRQEIRQPDGKVACFMRYFAGREAKMEISLEGRDVFATIYYEQVD